MYLALEGAKRSDWWRSFCAEEPNPLTPFPVKEGGTENVIGIFLVKEGEARM
jgi:hypothetical protein